MRVFFLLLLLLLTLSACTSALPFDRNGWGKHDDVKSYPYRERMLQDLMENYSLEGMSKASIVDLLGAPDNPMDWKNSAQWDYCIVTDYGLDIDPVYTQVLHIEFSPDEVVALYKVIEYPKDTRSN